VACQRVRVCVCQSVSMEPRGPPTRARECVNGVKVGARGLHDSDSEVDGKKTAGRSPLITKRKRAPPGPMNDPDLVGPL
jgi:hypothetical protein